MGTTEKASQGGQNYGETIIQKKILISINCLPHKWVEQKQKVTISQRLNFSAH